MKRSILMALAMLPITFACSSGDAPVRSAATAISRAKQAWKSIYEKRGLCGLRRRENGEVRALHGNA